MYCDLIITGLLGLDPSQEPPAVKPLIPEDWEYFLLEGVKIHGKTYTILYDRDGSRYGRGRSAGTIRGIDTDIKKSGY